MTTQSESALENELIHQLSNNGYECVIIKDESELLVNLKK